MVCAGQGLAGFWSGIATDLAGHGLTGHIMIWPWAENGLHWAGDGLG
jgi:hypothetical protein